MALIKLGYHEVQVGAPLDFPIYSSSGKLLVAKGYVLQSESQVERLFAAGAYKEGAGTARPDMRNQKVVGGTMSPSAVTGKPAGGHPALEAVIADFPCAPTGPEVFQLSLPEQTDKPFRAEYVGAIKGKALLVVAPQDAPQLRVGSVLDAKVFIGRHIYLFNTTVLARHSQPNDILHLEYPQKTRRHTLRKHLRIGVSMPARVFRNDAATTAHDAEVTNISMSGLALRCAEGLLSVGDHFRLTFKLTVADRVHLATLNAVVRNARSIGNGTLVGAEFTQLPEESRSYLQGFIFETALGTNI